MSRGDMKRKYVAFKVCREGIEKKIEETSVSIIDHRRANPIKRRAKDGRRANERSGKTIPMTRCRFVASARCLLGIENADERFSFPAFAD